VDDPQRSSDRPAAGALAPGDVPKRLVELSTDARAAVLIDASGEASAASGPADPDELAEGARELLRAVDRAADEPPAEVEAQVLGGSVFAVRAQGWTLVTVARRSALASLMLYDMRVLLGGLKEAVA
jgi:hypothetical protein